MTSFVGRAEDVAELARLLTNGTRLVTGLLQARALLGT
jgi:hypothetical protein